jgi:membrane-associated phospholipid phosphatase
VVSAERLAVRPVDRLLAGWIGFVTLLVLARGGVGEPTWWLLAAHAQFGILLALFTQLGERDRIGAILHDVYPLLLLGALYTELGLLTADLGVAGVLRNDRVIQGWDASLFGMQISYEWIRAQPSVFWSGVLHAAYLAYYPLIYGAPAALVLSGRRNAARNVILATMTAFVACYTVFALFPVAGPYFAFPHPTGPVRDVWTADIVYALLGAGSAVGTAFPSSHVAATVAAVTVLRRESTGAFAAMLVPAAMLVVSTVYCQMHYAVDALVGLGVGAGAVLVTAPLRQPRAASARSGSGRETIPEAVLDGSA